MFEGRGGAGEIERPHPEEPGIEQPLDLHPMGEAIRVPRAQGSRVMQAQRFDIGDDQPRRLACGERFRQGGNCLLYTSPSPRD